MEATGTAGEMALRGLNSAAFGLKVNSFAAGFNVDFLLTGVVSVDAAACDGGVAAADDTTAVAATDTGVVGRGVG